MQILLNNTETNFKTERLTVAELLSEMGYTFPMIVVKVNGVLVKKEDYDTTRVENGDLVEALHLISGG